jgi:putative DNA primase/helicase
MTSLSVPMTPEEMPRRATAIAQQKQQINGGSADADPFSAAFTEDEFLAAPRTPEQESAHRALYGEGGFSSWERVLSGAKPENRLGILTNALRDLFALAIQANVDSLQISDWGTRLGAVYDLDADAVQQVIVEAKETKPTPTPTKAILNGNRLRPLDLKAFLQLSIKPREMLLDPILPEKGLAMLYAARGTGKTHVALGIVYAVATGGKFLKWSAPRPRCALLIDGEMPAAALQERLASIVAGSSDVSFDPANIKILAGDLIEAGGIGNLASPDVQAELDQWLEGVDLLVLDNLSSLTAVIRDNDAESWGPIQEWLLRLRRRGISVLIVHHAGKGGQQRGTSRREDVLDTSISLRRPADYSPTEGAKFEVHLEKARGVHGDEARPFEAKLETRDGVASWTTKELEDANRARVEALLEDGLSVRDIADETGISKSAVARIKKAIEASKGGAGE